MSGQDAFALNRRIYAVLKSGNPGEMVLHLSIAPPAVGGPEAAFLWRGMLPNGAPLDIPLVSDPTANPALKGNDGLSAYQVARQQGYGGTTTQWLTTLVGAPGKDGASAYALAVSAGFTGTQAQWLASLKATVALASIVAKETATVAIAAGNRRLTFTVPGATVGDAILAVPTGDVPDGYQILNAWVSAADTVKVRLSVPLIAIGASYSIPCRVMRIG